MNKIAIPRDNVIQAYHLAKDKYHFTHAQIAELSGINRTRVTEILTAGKNTPQSIRPKTHRSMCKALSLNPETLEPIEKPERSAWDELTEIAILANPDVDFTPFHEWSGRYETELKNLPARGNNGLTSHT